MRKWETLDESRDKFKRMYSELRTEIAETRPEDIKELKGKWGKNPEVKESVLLLIAFFRKLGCWSSFTISELLEFSKKSGRNPNLIFYGILGTFEDDCDPPIIGSTKTQPEPWLVAHSDGRYMITTAFIKRCLGK
jgi:hypothetical protein